MKKNNYYLLTILPLLISLLIGCASTGVKTQEEKTTAAEHYENDEKINKVRISEFILGVGDTIEISVYRQEDLQKTIKIDNSGRIMLPLIGDVQAAGVGVFKLRDEIKERLSKYLIDPQVLVSISTVQSQKIMVLGEVNNPGVFALDTDMDILEAISKAGGMTKDAKMANVLLIRRGQGRPEVTSLNLKKVFKGGDVSQNLILQNGDIAYLPAVTIANVSRYFSHISQILSPFVNFESGVVLWPIAKDVLQGGDGIGGAPLTIPAK